MSNVGRMDTFLESFGDFMSGGGDDYDSDIDIQPQVNIMISELRDNLLAFKKSLFHAIVQYDKEKEHNPGDMGAMYMYHSLFLQAIAYWIGRLDGNQIPVPKINNAESHQLFEQINDQITQEVLKDKDAKILAYNELFIMSTSHPYNFFEKKNNLFHE